MVDSIESNNLVPGLLAIVQCLGSGKLVVFTQKEINFTCIMITFTVFFWRSVLFTYAFVCVCVHAHM